MEELSQTHETLINENAFNLQALKPVKDRVYELGLKGHIGVRLFRGSAYRPYENDLVDRGFKRVHKALM
ncbi:hypothetical protein Scep_007321 [Stephania cephalantha]|uniref:Uncharacterized protein n=1 Tax=Stephania cephalantha TaxID=152367 RepID=A0AAP0KBL9_9MAGN